MATTTMSQSMTNSDPGTGLGPAPPGRVGLAKRPSAGSAARSPSRPRRRGPRPGRQELEPDALLLGVVDLLGPGGQLLAAATVDDVPRRPPQPPGRPDGVHRDVAATDDDDALALEDGRVAVLGPRRP